MCLIIIYSYEFIIFALEFSLFSLRRISSTFFVTYGIPYGAYGEYLSRILLSRYQTCIGYRCLLIKISPRSIVLNIGRYTGISAEIPVFYPKRYNKCKDLPDIVLDRYGPIYRHVADISTDIRDEYI